MIRLIIADDHTLFREGLKQILDEYSDIVVVDEASNGPELMSKVQDTEADVVVLDISMPGRNGLELIGEIKELKQEINVLILSMYSEEQYAFRALRAGASGYLTKSTASQDLIAAIRKVAQGRKYISNAVAEQIASELASDSSVRPLHTKLSNREYQIMLLIASGKTLTEIADELALSTSTISTVRARLLEKMKMKTNAQIMHYAIKHELVK